MCGDYNQEELSRPACELRTAQKTCVSARNPRQLQKLLVSYLLRNDGQSPADDTTCTNNIDRYINDVKHYEWKPTPWARNNELQYVSLEDSIESGFWLDSTYSPYIVQPCTSRTSVSR